jgi:hypothetical protein
MTNLKTTHVDDHLEIILNSCNISFHVNMNVAIDFCKNFEN